MVTQVDTKTRNFLFIGKHDATERFLDNPRKPMLVVIDENEISTVKITKNLSNSYYEKNVVSNNIFETDYSDTTLLARLENNDHYDFVLSGIKPSGMSSHTCAFSSM